MSINVRQCIGCWQCLSACPKDVLGKIHFFAHRNVRLNHPENCKGCLACQKVCPRHAITSRSTPS
ncbi:4Fe-4S binding protein [Desulfosporosinus orientis]|uniref:4Fe-4S dicluster domain-containing protein n=1 Tax=Desulfosporosinus orientis TaxID=1563 RepID=UPI0009D92673